MSKRMLLPLLALLLLATLSLFPVNSQTSIAKAQSSNSSLTSVVSREYPYIAPHLVENATHYIYVTDWGNYTFNKTLPYVCRYTFRNGKIMVSFSTFWINASSMLTPLNPAVLIANNTFFKVQVDAYRLLTKVAVLTQTWDFSRTGKPKISVSLTKTASWNLGNFNLFWVVAGYQYVKLNETSTINCNKTLAYWKKGVKVEVGSTANPSDWREWLIVDWGDEGLADVWLGQFSIFGYNLAVVKVGFNVNDGQIDPSVVGTSTIDYATRFSFQRKAFYANGRFWVFYSDGTNMVYSTSTDGVTWTTPTAIRYASYGYYFSVWFDGTYVHYAVARRIDGEGAFYRRGTPNADGSITWTTVEQTVLPGIGYVNYYRRKTNAGVAGAPNLWVMDGSYSATANYTTEIVTGTTAAGNYYYIKPFANNTVSNGTALPTAITLQGWRTSTPVTLTTPLATSGFHISGYVKNRAAFAHAGYLYARLWKSPNPDMSGAVAITDWGYASISFTATAGEEKDFSISLQTSNPPNNEYLYVEFAWKITVAATGATAGLYLRADTSADYVRRYAQSYGFPYVSVDSNGYPYVSFRHYDGYDYYPYVVKSSLNNGTWSTASGFPYRLSTIGSSGWCTSVVPLTSGKMLAIYAYSYTTVKARAWTGTAWGTEVATTSSIRYGHYYSAVAQGDDVHLAFLKDAGYDILYVKYSYASNSFGTETTLQAGATSSSAPVLSINVATNDLYVFWAGYPTANHVYYRKYTASTGTWETAVDWIDETAEALTGNEKLTCFYQAGGSVIGLLYMTKTASPYNVKFAFLWRNRAPAVGDVKAPAIVYANQYFTVNVTVNDPDGVKDLQNCTLDFPGSKIRMRWLNATNTFEKILDPENCTLLKSQESFKTNLNSTAHTLTFKMKILWNYTITGTVAFNITVYDKLGWNGTKQATLKFSKYPIWLPTYNTNINFTETLHAENVICQDDKITLKNACLGSEPEKSDVTITVENANLTINHLLHDRKFAAELNGKTGTVAHLTLSFSLYKTMPHTIAIAGIPITTPYATKTEFDNYNGNCWYYDTTTNTIHIKATLHSPTSIYIDWDPAPAPYVPAPAPAPAPAPTPTPPYEVVTPTGITIPIWLILLALACIAAIGYIIVKRH